MDFGFMGAVGFTLVTTSLPFTISGVSTTFAEIAAWFIGVAVLGSLLGSLRLWSVVCDDVSGSSGGAPSVRMTGSRHAIGARPLAIAGRALLLLMAPALLEWLIVVPRAHAEPTQAAAVIRLP